MAKIIIDTDAGALNVDGNLTVIELIDNTMAMLTGVYRGFEENLDDKQKKEFFDLFNERFSRMLEVTFPDIEMHPEITEQILAKEAQYAERKAKAADKKAKKEAEKPIDFAAKAEAGRKLAGK